LKKRELQRQKIKIAGRGNIDKRAIQERPIQKRSIISNRLNFEKETVAQTSSNPPEVMTNT